MKTMLPVVCVAVCCLSGRVVHAETPIGKQVQPVVAKAIQFLEADMAKWRGEQGCSACHHGPLYLWSLNLARKQGYRVNEPALKEMTTWLLTDDEARLLPKPATAATSALAAKSEADRIMAAMMGRQGLLQPTIYLAHALHVLPADQPLRAAAWSHVQDHLARAQMSDGSLVGAVGRPPIFNTPQILTRTAVLGLLESTKGTNDLKLDAVGRGTLERAAGWLAQQPPDETHQGLVLRLWQATLDPAVTSEVAELQMRLKGLQRTDGGWSQTAEMSSDAFATGQSLYVLKRADIQSEDRVVQRGIQFLIDTQRADGTWPMTSRPHPETGKPATNLNPITYAGCAWGVLGIVSHVPAP